MTSLPVGMIIEGLVAVLLLVTIAYCWVLNSRLQRLRADEETLRATISELMTATEIAERAILGLKTTATDVDQTLGARLGDAERMSSALADQVHEGEKVFSRISKIAGAARNAHEERLEAQPVPQHPEPARQPVATAPGRARAASSRTDDIRSAAAEATARLERFRRRSEGAAA